MRTSLQSDVVVIEETINVSLLQLKIPATAIDAIMRYRRKFKCFTHINELLRIKSVDPETFRIINSNYKVEKSVDELRDTLHR